MVSTEEMKEIRESIAVDVYASDSIYSELKGTLTKRLFVFVTKKNDNYDRFLSDPALKMKLIDEWSVDGSSFKIAAVSVTKKRGDKFIEALTDHHKKAVVCGWISDAEYKDTITDMKAFCEKH